MSFVNGKLDTNFDVKTTAIEYRKTIRVIFWYEKYHQKLSKTIGYASNEGLI